MNSVLNVFVDVCNGQRAVQTKVHKVISVFFCQFCAKCSLRRITSTGCCNSKHKQKQAEMMEYSTQHWGQS